MTALRIERRAPLSMKAQTVATVLAVVAAVVVPQWFHWLGMVSGAGKAPGVAFSPMHLPVILVGFLAGPIAGAVSGLLGPVAAHLFSGMPTAAQLPFMMIELFGYGLSAGLLRTVRVPLAVSTVLSLLCGRVLRMIACAVAFYALGNETVSPLGIWRSVPSCLPGIVLQLTFVPLVVYWAEHRNREA